MSARHFQIGALASILLPALLVSMAKQAPVSSKQSSPGQIAGERDRIREDQVAKLFETLRADTKLPPLRRIGHRDSLEQKVCTVAVEDRPPEATSTNEFGFYKTSNPDSVNPELSKVALFNQLHPKNNAGYSRYSVAVWQVKDLQAAKPMYWVGVELFWSAGAEFFDYHFTDDIYYHNLWKKSIVAPCRNK